MTLDHIKCERHATAGEIVKLFFAPMMEECGAVDLAEVGIQDATGNDFDGEEVLSGICKQGQWAFADTNTNTVHWWSNKDATQAMVIHMLAHEIAHIADPRDEIEECEVNAEKYGAIAELAFVTATACAKDQQSDPQILTGDAFREFCKRTAAEVKDWPDWKTGERMGGNHQ